MTKTLRTFSGGRDGHRKRTREGHGSISIAVNKVSSITVGGNWITVSRYGIVVVLLLIGVLKFTPEEAAGIRPLVCHSPFMSWMYSVLSVQGVSTLIGITEIAIAALMALRPISPKASFVGSLGAVITFLITISFLFSTPGAAHLKYGFPLLDDAGQFLIKDLVLLGASLWTAAEAYQAVQKSGPWLAVFGSPTSV